MKFRVRYFLINRSLMLAVMFVGFYEQTLFIYLGGLNEIVSIRIAFVITAHCSVRRLGICDDERPISAPLRWGFVTISCISSLHTNEL